MLSQGVMKFKGDQRQEPLWDQAAVDKEAEEWAALWQENCDYDIPWPQDIPSLPPLTAQKIRDAAKSFPPDTGVGVDNIAPRALTRLSDEALQSLADILNALERHGTWTAAMGPILVVLLPKTDGGHRPIGLLPTSIRVWMRARAEHATEWEARNDDGSIYGGKGKGAQRAAWIEAFRAETAAADGLDQAQALLDLTKAFEAVPHVKLLQAAVDLEYPLALLKMSLEAYRLQRTVGICGKYSRLIHATRGITAGSAFATTELRVLLTRLVRRTLESWHCTLRITLYVDDLTLSARGDRSAVVETLGAATDFVVNGLQNELGFIVSTKKSVAVASTPALASQVAAGCSSRALRPVQRTKLLGTTAAGGRRRSNAVMNVRRACLKKKVAKFQALRKSGLNIPMMVQAMGTSAATYGSEIMGMADRTLKGLRCTIARAASAAGGGKNTLRTLHVYAGGLDPAVAAATLAIKHWAMAWWQDWVSQDLLKRAYNLVIAKFCNQRCGWRAVTGPAAALLLTTRRIGWDWVAADAFVDHAGRYWNVGRDSPARIAAAVKQAVQLKRIDDIAQHAIPGLIPAHHDAAAGEARRTNPPTVLLDVTPVAAGIATRKTRPHKAFPDWQPGCAAALVSTMTGGQWPQVRRSAVRAWNISDKRCQLCLSSEGTLLHRFECPCVVPENGWPELPETANLAWNAIGDLRRRQLLTTGFLVLRLPKPDTSKRGSFTWHKGPPDEDTDTEDLRWYIDGSAMDPNWPQITACGYAIVVATRGGRLVAWGSGIPPDTVDSSAAAEAWALLDCLQSTHNLPRVTTDCASLRSTAAAGKAKATDASNPLARIWCAVAAALDGRTERLVSTGALVWMPAHKSAAAIGAAMKSSGTTLTTLDWRANRLADFLARKAARITAITPNQRKLLGSAVELARFTATNVESHVESQQPHQDGGRPPWPRQEDHCPRCDAAPHQEYARRHEELPY